MKLLLVSGLCLVIASASAQTPAPQAPSQARLDLIWDHAADRLNTQTDIWFEDGEFPKVIQLLKVENILYPNDYEIATNLGWMLGNIQLYDEELATYIRYRNQNPTDPDRFLPEAQFYFLKRSYGKVVEILEPVDKTKAHPNNWRMLSQAYRRQGMFADSKRVLNAYLKLHPDDETAKANLRGIEEDLKKKG